MNLILPPLAEPSDIESQNVLAAGVIYAAFQLEQLRLFNVADRLVEMSQQGMLPLGGTAGTRLMKYARAAPDRLTEAERRDLYARSLGVGGTTQGPQSNREFNDLWLRFLSAVVAQPAGAKSRRRAALRKSGQAVAANLSRTGYGVGYFAAASLRDHTTAIVSLLSLNEIRTAFGARDMWQVIDMVSRNDLGGAVNVARHRTLATNGLVIVRWLATLAPARGRAGSAPAAPTDEALVKACEAWLTASATTDQ